MTATKLIGEILSVHFRDNSDSKHGVGNCPECAVLIRAYNMANHPDLFTGSNMPNTKEESKDIKLKEL